MKIRTPGLTETAWYFKDLYRSHVPCLLAFGAVFALGVLFGIRVGSGASITCITDGGAIVCLYIGGKFSLFSFILLTILATAVAFAIILAASGNKNTYWLSLLLLFYVTFSAAKTVAVVFVLFRLPGLPFIIVCLIPVRLVYIALLLTAWLQCAPPPQLKYRRGYSLPIVWENLRIIAVTAVVAVVLCIAEGILTYLLTIGIAL